MKSIFITAVCLFAAAPAMAHHHGHHPNPAPTAAATGGNATGGSATGGSATNTSVNTPQGGASNVKLNNEIYYPQSVPDLVSPVPRGYVPVLSVYGQLDYQQRGTVGAQVSIPLAR